jgi:hypothetical protein
MVHEGTTLTRVHRWSEWVSKRPAIALRLVTTGRRLSVPLWAVGVVALWAGMVILFNLYVVGAGHADTPCMFKNVTGGVPCPTCGSTRAGLALLQGDVVSAFAQNPLVLVAELGILVWVSVKLAAGRSIRLVTTPGGRAAVWAVASIAFLANWAYVISIDGPW